jgi:hypothetical protein
MQNTRNRRHPRERYGVVLSDDPHLQSPGALSLLVVSYWKNDKTVYDNKKWFKFRRRVLKKMLEEKGDLACHWCGKAGLVIEGKPFNNVHKLATLDHLLECSKGGGLYDESNLVCACRKCNNERS